MLGLPRHRGALGSGVAIWKYKALDARGATHKGELEAVTEADALARLSAKSLDAFELSALPPQLSLGQRTRIKTADLSLFVRQLATLLSAGVGILDALGSLARSKSHPGLSAAADAIARDLRAGQRLSGVMDAHLPKLPRYVSRLAELGEATGQSAKALTDAADRMEFEAEIGSEIRTALTYPAFLSIVGSVLVLLLFIFVVPRFDALIGDRTDRIPAFSRGVISIGQALSENLPVVALVVAGLVFGVTRVLRSPAAMGRIHSWAEGLPGVGKVLVRAELGGWARTTGIALDNGADLLSALRLGEDGFRSPRLKAAFANVRAQVRTGQDLELALAENVSDFDALNLDLVKTGRMSGKLADMLLFVGRAEEQVTRTRAKRFAALAEPVAILSISLVVGAIVISIVLAMTSLYDFDV